MRFDVHRRLVKHLFLAFLCVLFAACSDAPTHRPIAPGTVVLAFGDSVTFGTGAAKGMDYPAALAQRSGWIVINEGIPGDTAAGARSRIDAALDEHKPAMVIVELGGNDFLRGQQQSEVKKNLRAILQAVKKAGAVPVLVAVPRVSAGLGGLSDADLYAELAKEEEVFLIEGVFSKVLSDPSLRADRIHPNDKGYQVMADGFADALRKAGLLATR